MNDEEVDNVAQQKRDTVHFCKDCNNLLYPKRIGVQLYLSCKICEFEELAEHNLVYSRSEKDRGEVARFSEDLALDPTLPRSIDHQCSKCLNFDCVYFVPLKAKMNLRYLCRTPHCGNTWEEKED